MKAILHIFIFFLLANTIALSVIDTWLDSEELTEISSEESEEEKSDLRELLNIDMIATNLNFYFSKKAKHKFGDHLKNYVFIYTNNLYPPPEMII